MEKINIFGSVGVGGKNARNDIKAIQRALNQLPKMFIGSTKELAVDGRLGIYPEKSKTVKAIKLFQKKVAITSSIGNIDRNDNSHKKLNSKVALHAKPISSVPWMVTAYKEIGQSEISGKKANPKILEYFKASKFWGKDDSGARNAWCASFVSWVMEKNGYISVKNSFRAKEWSKFGKQIKNPIHGAIGIKKRRGGGHVAFVVGKSKDGKFLYMLGGNQADMVQIKRYPLSVWDSFVVPSDFNIRGITLPIYTKPVTDAGRED